jgi:hypothetical protein
LVYFRRSGNRASFFCVFFRGTRACREPVSSRRSAC